jgi:hypothetical protein
MNNKLDAFNKDKRKCPKCKEYFDEISVVFMYDSISRLILTLCDGCYAKWNADDGGPKFEDWCKDEQT